MAYLILQPLDGVGRIEEDETDEQSDENTQGSFGVDVRRSTPVLLEDTEQNLPELASEGRSKLTIAAPVLLLRQDRLRIVSETLELGLDLGVFVAVAPSLVPVNVSLGTRSSTNHLQHPLGRICLGRAGEAALRLEVVGHGRRVLADIAKVHGLATLGKEEQAVEALEQHG